MNDAELTSEIQGFGIYTSYTYTYASSPLMHLHCDHNCEHPIHCADSSQCCPHCHDKLHCPAIFRHSLDQTAQNLEHLQRLGTRVDDKQLERRLYPSHRHKQFPKHHCDISLPFLLRSSFRQLVSSYLREDKRGQISGFILNKILHPHFLLFT